MKITIFAAGSHGDIQPCIALGRGLQAAGYCIRLAAPENFGDFVRRHGLEFYSLRGDIEQLMAGETGRTVMETGGGNPLQSIQAIRTLIAPVVQAMCADVYAACQDADALICLGIFAAFGQSIAEALHIPIIHVEPAPLLPTRSFPAPSWPVQRDLGPLHNYWSGVAMLQVIWQWYRPFVHHFRRRLGLSPYRFAHFYRSLRLTPLLGAYSPSIIAHPTDWPSSVHMTGYLFLEPQAGWQAPPALQAFLDAGAPPVYIGFGSMAGRNPEQMAALVLQALAQSGQRGLLLTGWGGLRTQALPGNVFVLDAAPHRWLFPRMAAVVHHGGAGTTAEGLRAGVPSVIVPFAFDQPFWGARIQALGAGPAPIAQKRLSADRLANAINQAVTDPSIRQCAGASRQAIAAEDGIGNAVQVVRQVFGLP